MPDSEQESFDPLVYTLRPNRTALWLPVWLAEQLGIVRGTLLTEEQFGGDAIQKLMADRAMKERRPR